MAQPSKRLIRTLLDPQTSMDEKFIAAAEPDVLVSGNIGCLQHLAGYRPRYRTEIRAGGALLYGYDFVSAAGLPGLERRDPVLSASVLESSTKPPAPPDACWPTA